MSSVASYVRTVRFLGRLNRPADPPGIVESRDRRTPGGTAYDLYLPGGPPSSMTVALHGVTINGRRDHRLVHFARTLAGSGIGCLVPTLEGLARCRWTTADVDAIAGCIVEAASVASRPAVLIGFSLGGGYALVAATRPALRGRLESVLAFGAHHDLEDLLARMVAAEAGVPRTEDEWDSFIYFRLALADRYRVELGIAPALWPEIESLLTRYCEVASPEEKRRFYDAHLRGLPVARTASELSDRATAAALSPHGKLRDVVCPVAVVHDRWDTTVPPDHATRIGEELAGVPHEVVVTSLLSHVSLRSAVRLDEVARLVRVVAPLFGSVAGG